MLPALVGWYSYRKLSPITKWIAIMVFFACVPHLVNSIYNFFDIDKEAPVVRNVFYNVYIAQELLFLSLFFKGLLHSKTSKLLFKVSIALCSLLGLFLIYRNGLQDNFLTTWLSFNNIAYTMWILLLLYEIYDRDTVSYKFSKALLYYLFGLFFYSSCTIPAFGLWDYIGNHKDSYLIYLRMMHPVLNVIMYVSFSIGFAIEAGLFKKHKRNTYV